FRDRILCDMRTRSSAGIARYYASRGVVEGIRGASQPPVVIDRGQIPVPAQRDSDSTTHLFQILPRYLVRQAVMIVDVGGDLIERAVRSVVRVAVAGGK